ncbi:hypothetical protein HanPI659440_Chr11g0403791 [Helianthus annuus]|nr:hypothetical protein HanPI659440_Chr11g0403791 [Helianthus annuus]
MMKLVTQIMTWFTYVPCSTCEQCGKHQWKKKKKKKNHPDEAIMEMHS